MKNIITMCLSAKSQTHARTLINVRDLTSIIDEPLARDGTNQGLTPTETVLSSLMGCTNVVGHRLADLMGVKFENMNIDLSCQTGS